MKTLPTPAPWRVFQNDSGLGVSATRADVAHCGGFDPTRSIGEDLANARLIAAAPELLEALQWIVKNYPSHGPDGYPNLDWWARAQAALVKAGVEVEE